MRKIVPVQVPARTEQREVGLICDSCGKESRQVGGWSENIYEVARTHLSMETGTRYPEGGITTVVEAHVCPSCMTNKVIPALEQLGITFHEREHEHEG